MGSTLFFVPSSIAIRCKMYSSGPQCMVMLNSCVYVCVTGGERSGKTEMHTNNVQWSLKASGK